jgi:ferredoxin-NADP reductase
MAKKAKVSVNGYFSDLVGWFKLLKRRKAWIDSGNPRLDTSDPIAELAKRLHPGLVQGTVIEVKQETPSSRTYTIKPDEGYQLPLHYAGQYMSVKFDIAGKKTTRPFAISSPPMTAYRDNRIQFTLKKKEGGYVSTHIWDTWKEGQKISFDLPFGNIYYSRLRDAKHIVGIAGGSGITIFRSIIADMSETNRPGKLTLLYGSRNAGDILFKDELEEMAAKSGGRVKIIHILSEPNNDWTGEKGFISAGLIEKLVPDFKDTSFYISGPAALYDFIGPELDKLGVSLRRRRMECYGESDHIEHHRGFPGGQENKIYTMTVIFGQDQEKIPMKSTETVAVALERVGLAVDTQCRSGECGWCRSRLCSGKVWQRPESNGVRARDKDAGYFHPCSAYPMENITVQVFARI